MATPNKLSDTLERFRLDGIHDTGIKVGDGSYATVLQYDFRGLKCVGKRIHRLLYEHASPAQRADMLRRFEEECELLGGLHHPNIVQFLGVHVETGSELPVLVMEYLPTNLSGYLERHGVLPIEISYGILRDVALGLRYLHDYSPPIVHRDLSANNVLLTASLSAKISDLGVAKILNITPSEMTHTSQQMSTKAPGTPCYMPPEALISRPKYTGKIDSYSFGVMILHVLCGEWPFPTDAFQHDPQNTDTFIPVTEVDRRARFMKKMGSDHPLSGLVRQCLSNTPDTRPDSANILQQINAALSQVPSPAETVFQQLEGLRSENQRLETENERLRNDNQSIESEVQMLESEIQSLESENEILQNRNQALEECSQAQPSSSGAAVNQPLVEIESVPCWEEMHDRWFEGGSQDAIFVISNGVSAASNADVVPRYAFEMTEEDRTDIINQGLPPDECTDDISIMQARVRLDKELEIVHMISGDQDNELSRSFVLKRLESCLKKTKKHGAVIYYIGHGKKDTGDWCFKDGFITFKDIAEIYSRVFRHRGLTIITDCSHSGAWVDTCLKYLTEQGMKPCGHSLKVKGILLKVYASCRPEETAATNCFFVRGVQNDKTDGTVKYYMSKELRESQHSYGYDTSEVKCGRSIEDDCAMQHGHSEELVRV